MEAVDYLWPGGPRLMRREGVFKLGTDSVLLGHFARPEGARRALDLGCGGGVLGLMLLGRRSALTVDGVERDGAALALCRENVALNGLEDRFRLLPGDYRDYRALLEAGAYDLAVSNPPYFPRGSGFASETLDHARREEATLPELCAAAAWALRWGGRFALVHRPERLSELFCALSAAGLEPKRLRLVQKRPEAAPSLVLAEAVRGAKPGLLIEPPLLLTGPEGGESEEIQRIYGREGL